MRTKENTAALAERALQRAAAEALAAAEAALRSGNFWQRALAVTLTIAAAAASASGTMAI